MFIVSVKDRLHHLKKIDPRRVAFIASFILIIGGLLFGLLFLYTQLQKGIVSEMRVKKQLTDVQSQLNKTTKQYEELKAVDQIQRNNKLEAENKQIHDTYTQAVKSYENLLNLKEVSTKTQPLDEKYSKALSLLSERNYASAAATLKSLDADIQKQRDALTAAYKSPDVAGGGAAAPVNNSPPGSGYQRQRVQTDRGEYLVDIISADLNSAKVIVDTASDGDCSDNCPVMSLGEFASRSGAFAAVNGQYFCPSTYPSCAGKANSFDTLLMNKNHTYFNSANNVYSTNPAAVFMSGSSRFMGHASEWGRDTGVDAVISNWPLLVQNGNIAVSDAGDAKQSGKGNRAFIGGSGNMVYIGVIYNANVTDMAYVLQKMGIQNGLNLDSGGSLALWNNGRYIVGPGRGLPFGILLVRR
jgi:exopolysaccharide biosynthesis protein